MSADASRCQCPRGRQAQIIRRQRGAILEGTNQHENHKQAGQDLPSGQVETGGTDFLLLVEPWALLVLVALIAGFVLALVALVGLFVVLAAGKQRHESPTGAPAPRPSPFWWSLIVGLTTIVSAGFTAANFLFH